MSKASRWVVILSGLCIIAGLGTAVWFRLSKPTALTVAVGPTDSGDAELLSSLGRKLAANGSRVRISVVPTSGPVEALDRLNKGEALLAVVRSDGANSDRIRALAVLHSDPVAIVTPEKSKVEDFAALKGKTIGVIGPPDANGPLLRTLQKHYGASGATKSLPAQAAEISAAIRNRTVDALLFVAPATRGDRVAENWNAVRRASGRKLGFVAINDAEAIAASNPAYEAGEIVAGQFGGSPTLPDDSVPTLTVATYLVADRNASEDSVITFTRALFQERQAISAEAPLANLIKAASTDKDAIYPVHPGAKAYYDGEEKTLMDRYGDWLFYGPMLIGALGSGLMVLVRFLGLRKESNDAALLSRIREVISSVQEAKSLGDLELIRRRVDAAVERLAEEAALGHYDEQRTAVISLAVSYIDHLMAERRECLNREPELSSSAVEQLRRDAAA